MSTHLMIVPSLNCQAGCKYCFGPHEGNQTMTLDTVQAIVEWQNSLETDTPLEITFHGGEPLLAGIEFYRAALPMLREGMAPRKVNFGMQSNLWALTDDHAKLLRKHFVSVGTSLDGPQEINDNQRGKGYFDRTSAGIECGRRNNLQISCISTFTSCSAPKADEVFDFFLRKGQNFSVHGALPSMQYERAIDWGLSVEEYGDLLIHLFNRYLENEDRIRINSLDAMCQGLAAGKGSICTFGDCLGNFLAIDPTGDIYPCQRFAGQTQFRLGNVYDTPSFDEMIKTPVWELFAERQARIEEECGDCEHLAYCRGGCPYNVLATQGSFEPTLKDPYCTAYQKIFDFITTQALDEVFSEENLQAVAEKPDPEKGLLRKGKILSLMNGGTHPYETAGYARLALSSVALAATGSPQEATERLFQAGVIQNREHSLRVLESQFHQLNLPLGGLNNLYLHITFACPLHCTHCYAQAGEQQQDFMSINDIADACQQAAHLGFRQVVLTGGEPLIHPQREEMLRMLKTIRTEIKPTITMLRTSLGFPIPDDILYALGTSVDKVVVSVDGNRETHDQRRGAGCYDLTVQNLRTMVQAGTDTDLSLAAVLPTEQVQGAPGNAVRALSYALGLGDVRFRPLLPLGRASNIDHIQPETLWGHLSSNEMAALRFTPNISCGLGQNLYVEPDGKTFPCYAWHGENWLLGNILEAEGIDGVVKSKAFNDLRTHTVNTNEQCQHCALRYLCGGACRAWNQQPAEKQINLDAAPRDCTILHARARNVLLSTLDYLQIPPEDWLFAGLPIPEAP